MERKHGGINEYHNESRIYKDKDILINVRGIAASDKIRSNIREKIKTLVVWYTIMCK